MNIWEILQIEPTADKRQIRRAYAARSKVMHPEEKPDEFRMLYEAYQAALELAGRGDPAAFSKDQGEDHKASADSPIEADRSVEAGDDDPEEPKKEAAGSEEERLSSYFKENLKRQEQRLARFHRHWPDLRYRYPVAEVKEWWNAYLRSEEFQEIKWHPKVLAAFSEAIDWNLKFEEELLEILWEVYGQKEEDPAYEGDARKLCQFLRSEHELRVYIELVRQQNEKKKRIRKKVLTAAAILFCLLTPVLIWQMVTEESRYVARSMSNAYPEDTFSRPEKVGTQEDGKSCYELHSEKYPDFQIFVQVGESGDYRYIKDNYRSLLLGYYAEQYGISCRIDTGRTGADQIPTLYYPDYEQIDDFCRSVETMFREQEGLGVLEEVGICPESILFPKVVTEGGTVYSDLVNEQVYTAEELADASALSEQIRRAYIAYMFNYEAWNLTKEQYRELGPVYENMCMAWAGKEGSWCDLQVDGEKIGQIFIAIRSLYVTEAIDADPTMTQTIRKRYIPVGDAWLLFMVNGADLVTSEDGSGFHVKHEGKIGLFGAGTNPVLLLEEVENWY